MSCCWVRLLFELSCQEGPPVVSCHWVGLETMLCSWVGSLAGLVGCGFVLHSVIGQIGLPAECYHGGLPGCQELVFMLPGYVGPELTLNIWAWLLACRPP